MQTFALQTSVPTCVVSPVRLSGGRIRPCPSVSRPVQRLRCSPVCIQAPSRPQLETAPSVMTSQPAQQPQLISRETVKSLEAELDSGLSLPALRRFSTNLESLPADQWEAKLRPVMHELAYNLESFNPAFTAVLLKVQSSIGFSDYVQRDMALKNLIQPLAGEYGMHNGQEQAKTHRELFSEFYADLPLTKTHRELFSEFYADLLGEPLEAALGRNARPVASVELFGQMMRDLMSGGRCSDPVEQASYAMGYNLAIEYLADYEKTWMLDSFRVLNEKVLQPAGRTLNEWVFLEVHAEGEAEHAAIGHDAVVGFVPAGHAAILRRAMLDHDRDFSAFYNKLADMLEL
ncbi:hypothetical protein WJX72_001167 [[Myrmecia] bisecta]|uniref:Uncharacterized protein n=1 Tax=[Myrmecia] bisecta TaxID=41462 RepID=A0AAW1QNW6_9CHLO